MAQIHLPMSNQRPADLQDQRTFTHRFYVRASLERVVAFHSDSRALKILTPPPVMVQFHEVQPLGEGSIADFTLWLGPLPVRWVAVHSELRDGHGFVDTQTTGPYKFWQHRHSFRVSSEDRIEIVDEIQATPSDHLLLGLVSRLMWLSLGFLFAYRARVTRRHLERETAPSHRFSA